LAPWISSFDARNLEVFGELVLLGRGSDGNLESGISHAYQQVGDRREGTHKLQIVGLKTLATPRFQFLAVVSLFVGSQEDRNELVTALPYLTSDLLEADIVAELHHRFVPGERVEIDGVQ
jgi:hypothetical protein